jgi:hypothetical protein
MLLPNHRYLHCRHARHIPIDITGCQYKPLEFSRGPSLPAGGGNGNALISFVIFIFIIPVALKYPEMKFVMYAIVVYSEYLGQCI